MTLAEQLLALAAVASPICSALGAYLGVHWRLKNLEDGQEQLREDVQHERGRIDWLYRSRGVL